MELQKSLRVAVSTIAIVLLSCNREQLENLTVQSQAHETSINTVNEQIAAIKATLEELNSVDKSINEAIEALGEEDSAIKDALNAHKEALEAQITSLDAYVKQELSNNRNWVSATFATLEQFNALSTTVATLGESLSFLNGKVDAIKSELLTKISGDISALELSMKSWVNEQLAGYYTIAQLDAKLAALEASIESGDQANSAEVEVLRAALTQQKVEITSGYQAAIAKAIGDYNGVITQKVADEIAAVNTKITALETRIEALETGVAALEESIRSLFSLIDQLETKLSDLSAAVKEGDETNSIEIESLRTALQALKEELISAYQSAIAQAISDNNGVINKRIADEVSAISERITLEVAGINAKINEIETRISLLESNIATISEQISGINTTLEFLKATERSLQEAIDALNEEDASIRLALQEQKASLEAQIADLEAFVQQQLSLNKDWVSATFSTLAQFNALCELVASLEVSLSGLSESINVVKAQEVLDKVAGDMATLESSMKSWVNEQLSEYYTIAQIDAKLAALAESILNGDSANAREIANLRDDLAQQKTDITSAYQAAIASAINENNGAIDEKIAAEVASLNTKITLEVEAINSKITALEERIDALESELAEVLDMIQSVTVIPAYSDGSVGIRGEDPSDICFEIRPLTAAEKIKDIPLNNITLSAVATQTKSAIEYIPITIKTVSYSNGIVTLTVVGDNLSNDFFLKAAWASARLYIESGKSSVSSSYFPLTPIGPHRKMVDMGLSVKWAACNLGGESPFHVGYYYAWGEIEPKEDYSLANYSNPPYSLYTDAARILLGGTWRMPTAEEFEELLDENNTFITFGNDGLRIRSKITGNTVLFPTTGGFYNGTELTTNTTLKNNSYCWSSTLPGPTSSDAFFLSFNTSKVKLSGNSDVSGASNFSRYHGAPIRPVCEL